MSFKILHKDKKSSARTGVLETKSGKITTPFFMPVATKGNVKFMTTDYLQDIGVPAVISNALILSLRPGTKLLRKVGGIKKFMNFNGINATDSGGFQMYSKFIYLSSNDEGVTFKNPFSTCLKTHKLKGKLNQLWSFSVNYGYRIIFEFADSETVYFFDIGSMIFISNRKTVNFFNTIR